MDSNARKPLFGVSDKMSFKPHRLARKFACSKSRHDTYQSTNNKDADQIARI